MEYMRVVSFDIGTKNLAWCLVEADTPPSIDVRLLDCKLIALQGENLQQWVQSMHEQVNDMTERLWFDSLTACPIELQPSLNPKAVALSKALHILFLTEDIPVCFCSPNKKLAGLPNPLADLKLPKDKYKRRKALSTYHAMRLADERGKMLLEAQTKKDDVSDAMLMAFSWLRTRSVDV